MLIKTLEQTSIADLTDVFNEAFSDYVVPVHRTEAITAEKLKGDNIDLSLSVGYFIDDKLCGFILHGIGERSGQAVVWNGGTGVIPSQRGQGISNQLYEFIIPHLRARGFKQTALEVIKGNDPAIHTYQKNGFTLNRMLECYKGFIAAVETPENITFKIIEEINWPSLHEFRSWEPTFQNNDPKINLLRSSIEVLGAYDSGRLVGYIIFDKNPEAGDIFQFAVEKASRQKGIGKALFSQVAQRKTVALKIVNVDGSHQASNSFFEKIGFEKIVSQLEMVRDL